MNPQSWLFGKAVRPLFAEPVTFEVFNNATSTRKLTAIWSMTIEDAPCLKSEDVDIKSIPHEAVWKSSWIDELNDFNNQAWQLETFQLSLLYFFQETYSILPELSMSVITILMINMIWSSWYQHLHHGMYWLPWW